MKIEFVKTKSKFNELKKDRAITFVVDQPEDTEAAVNWVLSLTEFKTEEITGYISEGYYLNLYCRCNVFYEDATLLSFMLSDLKQPEKIIENVESGHGRLFDDVLVEFSD